MTEYYDLAIRWNNKESSIQKLVKEGRVSVHGFPHYLCRGKCVAIVSKKNEIQLMFRVSTIDGPQPVKLANGKSSPKGYMIRAAKRTIRRLDPTLSSPIQRWPAIGAFAYFDEATMEQVFVGAPSNDFKPYTPSVAGIPHGDPEAKLVHQYVEWMGKDVHFGRKRIGVSNLFVDLFDRTHWQLLEAKMDTSRKEIRKAIGQLYDYRRYYKRPPSLAVLLPSRPTVDCVKLLTDNHISVIWRNPRGSFTTKRWQS